MVSNRSHK